MGYKAESQYERELDDMPDEVKEMAKQILKILVEKDFRIHDAKSTLRACEIYIECNCKLKSKFSNSGTV
jgi:hypothetical protein